MLNTADFYNLLNNKGIAFSTGVPDSLLKNFCAYLSEQGNDIIAANEGGAIALAAGYHIATGAIPLVYLQNSGFGNIINPYTSLIDKEVYKIPMLLMIGWRGEPGIKDAPQHLKQGRVMEDLLKSLEIAYIILSKETSIAQQQVNDAFAFMQANNEPFAFLVQKNTFSPYVLQPTVSKYSLSREEAIRTILNEITDDPIIVSTTGKTSRELFECRTQKAQSNENDFLTIGGMGHASQIALGIALQQGKKKVICLDGDGAAIMHMGHMAIIGDLAPSNFKHILLNNGSHDSVGGQPTVGHHIDFLKIAEACNYQNTFSVASMVELKKILPVFLDEQGPSFLEIKIIKGARKDLGRPTISPLDNKLLLMKKLASL